MAGGTIAVTNGWTYAANGVNRSMVGTQTSHTLAGNGVVEGVQSIGFAAHEALVVNDVATFGYLYARHAGTANFVQIGYDDGGTFRPFIKLYTGQEFSGWINAAPYAQADTAAVLLDYKLTDR